MIKQPMFILFLFSSLLYAREYQAPTLTKLDLPATHYWPAPAITTNKMHTGRFIATITPVENIQLIPGPDASLTQPEPPYQSAYTIPTWSKAEREIISYKQMRAPASLQENKHDLMHWEHLMP